MSKNANGPSGSRLVAVLVLAVFFTSAVADITARIVHLLSKSVQVVIPGIAVYGSTLRYVIFRTTTKPQVNACLA